MPAVAKSEVIVPKKLSPEARRELADALYEVHCEVFDGVDKAAFVKYVIESKADDTKVLVHKSAEGRIVGYFAFHTFEKQLGGRAVAVIRGESGIMRAYRGQNANAQFGMSYVLSYVLKNPSKPIYYLGSLVHPSSYLLFARYAEGKVWPNHERPVPPDIQAFMLELADAFAIPAVDPAHPLVRQVGWKTRDTEVERNYWRHNDKPAVQFFLKSNPGYAEGHGLLTLVPLDLRVVLEAIRQLVDGKVQVRVESAVVALQRLPIGAQIIRPAEVRKRLRAVPLFSRLDDASLEAIVRSAEVVALKAGTFLFREQDPGEDLYVIARGAAYVLSGPRGEEVVIDEMGSGAIFGEIAMLSGARRTASIRTAVPTALVRIRRDALFPLMKTNAALREAIWGAFAARLFDDYLRTSPRHEGLGRLERSAWIQRGRHDDVASGETVSSGDEAFLFVLSGAAEVEQEGGARFTAPAPLLVEVKGPLRLTAKGAVRLVRVPRIEGASAAAELSAAGAA